MTNDNKQPKLFELPEQQACTIPDVRAMENQKHIEAYQELFNYLYNAHDLILLQSEMDEIIKLSEKTKLNYNEASVGKKTLSVPQSNELLPHVSIMLPKCTNCGDIMKVAAYECKCGIVKEG